MIFAILEFCALVAVAGAYFRLHETCRVERVQSADAMEWERQAATILGEALKTAEANLVDAASREHALSTDLARLKRELEAKNTAPVRSQQPRRITLSDVRRQAEESSIADAQRREEMTERAGNA